MKGKRFYAVTCFILLYCIGLVVTLTSAEKCFPSLNIAHMEIGLFLVFLSMVGSFSIPLQRSSTLQAACAQDRARGSMAGMHSRVMAGAFPLFLTGALLAFLALEASFSMRDIILMEVGIFLIAFGIAKTALALSSFPED